MTPGPTHGRILKPLLLALAVCACIAAATWHLWKSYGSCSLSITSIPSGATVFLDDRHVGMTPLEIDRVAVGVHSIRMQKHGFEPWSAVLHLPRGRKTIMGEMRRVGTCSLSITSTPSGADVFIDGESRGKTLLRLSDLSPGEHEVRLVLDNYLPHEQTITLDDHREHEVTIELRSKIEDYFLKRISVLRSHLPNYTELVHHYLVVGQYEKARDVLKKALSLAASGDAAHKHVDAFRQELLKAYYGEFRLDEPSALEKVRAMMESVLEEYSESAPSSRELYVLLGKMYCSRGKLEEAANLYRKGIGKWPQDIELNIALGRVLYQCRKYDQAVLLLERLLEHAPHVLPAKMILAEAHEKMGNLDKAVQIRLELTSLGKSHRDVVIGAHMSLAGLFHRQGQFKEAAQQWEGAAQMAAEPRQKFQLKLNAADEFKYAQEHDRARKIYQEIVDTCPVSEIRLIAAERLKRM